MDDLVVNRWQKSGKDRLYVNRKGRQGPSVAWFDLQSGETHMTVPGFEAAARAAIAEWLRSHNWTSTQQPPPCPPLPVSIPPLSPLTPENDLSRNLPGAAVEQKVREKERERSAFVRWVARTLDLSVPGTDSWRAGFTGEQVVGDALARLDERAWHVLHAVQWPSGADIDHLVIGPAGVFTVNAKHHADARIWVGGGMLRVNNRNTDHVKLSLAEAERVATVLRSWCGWEVPVRPVLAIVGAQSITLSGKEPPRVLVTEGPEIDKLLSGLPVLIAPAHRVSAVFEVARRRDVWKSAGRQRRS